MRKHPLANCDSCPLKDNPYVPSAGPQDAEIAFVGEAPGKEETKSGYPFAGRSGQLLNPILAHVGVDRSKCFITNVCLCRPDGNAVPPPLAIAACSERLQADLGNRTTIVALGATASSAVLKRKVKITKERVGPPQKVDGQYIIPTFHPAAILRNSRLMPDLVTDLEKLKPERISVTFEPPQVEVVDEPEQAAHRLSQFLCSAPIASIDIETGVEKDDDESEHPDQILCVGLGYQPGRPLVIGEGALASGEVQSLLTYILNGTKTLMHNGKSDLGVLGRGRLWADTMLANYCLDERGGIHGLQHIGMERLGWPAWKNDFIGPYKSKIKRNYGLIPRDVLHEYNGWDVDGTLRIWQDMQPELEPFRELHDFLIRASNALVTVESQGIAIDETYLKHAGDEISHRMNTTEQRLLDYVENPRSPKQVLEALHELGFKNLKDTQAKTLEEVADRHPFITDLLAYRKEHKLYATYIVGLQRRLVGGRLHTSYRLHGTTTGRLASRNPNLQNVPRGSSIRDAFVSEEGHSLIQADYRAIELRAIACESRDPYLREVFRDESRDIHSEVGASTGIPRQLAKVMVYGLSYDMTAEGLAYQTGIPVKLAAKHIRKFFRQIPAVVAWQEAIRQQLLHDDQPLRTRFGREHRVPLISRDNAKDVIKEGLAFIPQSTAGDICTRAMCELVENGIQVRLPVHDSIMVECKNEDVSEVSKYMTEVMMESGRQYDDYVPWPVEVKVGTRWGQV